MSPIVDAPGSLVAHTIFLVWITHHGSHARESAVAIVGALSLAITLIIPIAPDYSWTLPDGRGGLLAGLGARLGLPLTAWFPLFHPATNGPGDWRHALLIPLWATALLLLWALTARREHAARHTSRR